MKKQWDTGKMPASNPLPGTIVSPIDGAEMVLIPAGEFTMGISQEELHHVFALDDRENPVFATEVPIFIDTEFLGTAGGCGLLRDQNLVDAYLVHRTTGMDEKVIENMSEAIETIPNDRLESVIEYVEKKVAEIIPEYGTAIHA